jgi:hypothetical protein
MRQVMAQIRYETYLARYSVVKGKLKDGRNQKENKESKESTPDG